MEKEIPITPELLLGLGFDGFEDGHQFTRTIRPDDEEEFAVTITEYAKDAWWIETPSGKGEARTLRSLLFWISTFAIKQGKSAAKRELKKWLKS